MIYVSEGKDYAVKPDSPGESIVPFCLCRKFKYELYLVA